jgi:hypothetical protein
MGETEKMGAEERAERALGRGSLCRYPEAIWARVLLQKRNVQHMALKAVGGRLSESRMRENFTYGSRWQGMETRIR